MNSLDALRLMVDHYKGGREAVALRLGKSDDVLRKELAGAHGFKLGVVTACSIASLCAEQGSEHAGAYATAVASHCGAHVQLQPRTGDTGGDLVQRASVAVKETAEVMTEVAVRYADGAVCLNDMRAIEKEANEAIHAIQAVLQSARAAYRASQPQGVQSPDEFVRGLGDTP